MTKWKNINELINYPQEGILSKELLKTGKVNITLFCMAKGTELSEHTSTKEGYVYVVDGRGVFNLAGEDIKMAPGIFIPLAVNAKHSLKAEDNTTFILSLAN